MCCGSDGTRCSYSILLLMCVSYVVVQETYIQEFTGNERIQRARNEPRAAAACVRSSARRARRQSSSRVAVPLREIEVLPLAPPLEEVPRHRRWDRPRAWALRLVNHVAAPQVPDLNQALEMHLAAHNERHRPERAHTLSYARHVLHLASPGETEQQAGSRLA